MKVIVACEFSGIVRDAFIRNGYDAISCDLLESESPGPHIQDDIRNIDLSQYDLMIAHPPCTYLAVSGARWFADRESEQIIAIQFVEYLLAAPVPHIALENPISIISTHYSPSAHHFRPLPSFFTSFPHSLHTTSPLLIIFGFYPRFSHHSNVWFLRTLITPSISPYGFGYAHHKFCRCPGPNAQAPHPGGWIRLRSPQVWSSC